VTGGLVAPILSDEDERRYAEMLALAEDFPPGAYIGSSWRQIQKYGIYQEPALQITQKDEMSFQLYAALAVYASALTRSTSLLEGTKPLNGALEAAIKGDRQPGRTDVFPYYEADSENGAALSPFRDDLVQLAEHDPVAVIARLKRGGICHEWTVKPGKRIFDALLEALDQLGMNTPDLAFRKKICAADGYRVRLEHGADYFDVAKELAFLVAAMIGFEQVFLPITVTVTVILMRHGLNWYCEECKPGRAPAPPGQGRLA
jgi:hypothetical protein